MFFTYLDLGFYHIVAVDAYDHIVFLIALCAVYRLREWRRAAILATAFTIGHSVSLALAVLQLIVPPYALIEKLIPVTIALTALLNMYRVVFNKTGVQEKAGSDNITGAVGKPVWKAEGAYFIAAAFGAIHGMAFSQLLVNMETHIFQPLLAFNIGIELGQLLLLSILLIVSWLALDLLRVPQRVWTLSVSSLALLVSIYLFFK